MREIKFRGKRKDNGEWVYGSLLRDFGKATWIVNTIQDIKDATSDNVWFQVDPKTVGQYTELPDKNGKEIYEGDVVDCHRSGDEEYTVRVSVDDIRNLPRALFGSNLLWCEVIGNVWENGDLLQPETRP